MKKVILYEPSIGSNNLGDQVIVDGVKNALKEYLDDSFIIEMPTHTPLSARYINYLGNVDMKIVCGSNIIVGKLNTILHLKQWALSMRTISSVAPCVLIGVGSQQYNQKFNIYTRLAYKKMFRKDYIHSVRDTYTEEALKKIGITNVINTGCPTMWGITPKVCASIPKVKANSVVFTLTDYKPNKSRDEYFIEVLNSNYKEVYFWAQGTGDFKYFSTLKGIENIKIIKPNINAYNEFLETTDADFIGTRLHGGMRALQKKHRTIIIGIDNRAIELKRDFNIPVLEDTDINMLDHMINSNLKINIKLPYDNIKTFLKQFEINY